MEKSDSTNRDLWSSETNSYDPTHSLDKSPGSGSDSSDRQVTAYGKDCLWRSLPKPIVKHILDYVPPTRIPLVVRVCKHWHELGLDSTRLKKLLAGDLECSSKLVDELKERGCDPALLRRVIHTQKVLKGNPWQWLKFVHTFFASALASLPPDKLASVPDFTVGPEASIMGNTLDRLLEDAWEHKLKSQPYITCRSVRTITHFSYPSAFALTAAADSTNTQYKLPGTWTAEFTDNTAPSQRKLRLLTIEMLKGDCCWKNLSVQTLGPVTFRTIKKFLTAVGQQQFLKYFHFCFDRDYMQSKEFWRYLSENLIRMPRLKQLSFELPPTSPKDLTTVCPWVTQMQLSLRKMALNKRLPAFKTLKITGANDDTTVLAAFNAVTNTGIRRVSIVCGKMTSIGARELARKLRCDHTLTYLSLRQNGLTQEAMQIILSAIRDNNTNTLEHVSLVGNDVPTAPDLLELIEGLSRDRGLQIDVAAPPPQ